jgi:hypothetical protein
VFRSRSDDERSGLTARVKAVELELRKVRREAAELRAAHDDAIDLALIGAVPNSVFRLITDARDNRWTVTYKRKPRREGCGTIYLEHPDDTAHNCSIDLPLPDDPATQRRIENDVRMRVGWSQAA